MRSLQYRTAILKTNRIKKACYNDLRLEYYVHYIKQTPLNMLSRHKVNSKRNLQSHSHNHIRYKKRAQLNLGCYVLHPFLICIFSWFIISKFGILINLCLISTKHLKILYIITGYDVFPSGRGLQSGV